MKNKNISDKERLLGMMDDDFSRCQWLDAADDMSVPCNMADSWLRRMIKKGIVDNTDKAGVYRKSSTIL